MVADRTDGSAGPAGPPEPSRRLARLLRGFAAKVDAVRTAEFNYHGVMLTESLRQTSRAGRASDRRIDEAFGALTETVVDLQDCQAAVLSLAEVEGISAEAVCALDETFGTATRQYAGYLAAHTFDQVQELAEKAPRFRGRTS
jgi:hypothetical protein